MPDGPTTPTEVRPVEKSTTPKPVEKPNKPIGPTEEKMVQTIDSLEDGKSPDPDKSFQAILDTPTQEAQISARENSSSTGTGKGPDLAMLREQLLDPSKRTIPTENDVAIPHSDQTDISPENVDLNAIRNQVLANKDRQAAEIPTEAIPAVGVATPATETPVVTAETPDTTTSDTKSVTTPEDKVTRPLSEPSQDGVVKAPTQEGTIQAPKVEEAAAYKVTLQTLSEKIVQETDPAASAKLRQEMANVVADYIPQLPDDRATAFIAEFNQNNPGLLKSQEFRLLQSRGEKVIMVDESGSLREMIVTKENARTVLGEIKGKDETIRGKSYELRKEIVRRSDGEITTYEAYTYPTDIPQGGELDAFLDNPDNWVPERRALQQQIIDQEYAKALALSARLGDPEPTVYALRGNTAAGKTTATRNDELFRKALDESGQPSGSINPDTYKTGLKTSEVVDGRQAIGHQQAHEEGSMMARKISGKIAESESSMVIDKRMNKAKNITELIALAEQTGKEVKILDVDVPLETSLIRVLGRKIGGEDPTVPFDAVAEGYEGVRQNRGALIEQVINNPKIKDYALYVADESGTSIKAAQKVNGEFMVLEGQEDAFQIAVSKDTESTVEQLANTVIDETYIGGVLSRTPEAMQPKVRTSLERYSGKTLKDALDIHAQKLNE